MSDFPNGLTVTGALSATGMVTGQRVRLSDAQRLDWGDGNEWVVGDNGGALLFGVDNVEKGRFNSTGLAVTGALSASGAITAGGTTQVQLQPGGRIALLSVYANDNMIISAKGAGQLLLNYGAGSGGVAIYNGTTGGTYADFTSTGLAVTGGISSTGQIDAGQALVVAGSIAAHQTNKAVMQYGGGNAVDFRAYGATPGTGYFRWGVGGGGGSTDTLAMQLDASGNLSATGGITTGSYTVATRPAHAAGRIIHVTDGGAGAVFQGSAGGAWVNLG